MQHTRFCCSVAGEIYCMCRLIFVFDRCLRSFSFNNCKVMLYYIVSKKVYINPVDLKPTTEDSKSTAFIFAPWGIGSPSCVRKLLHCWGKVNVRSSSHQMVFLWIDIHFVFNNVVKYKVTIAGRTVRQRGKWFFRKKRKWNVHLQFTCIFEVDSLAAPQSVCFQDLFLAFLCSLLS